MYVLNSGKGLQILIVTCSHIQNHVISHKDESLREDEIRKKKKNYMEA